MVDQEMGKREDWGAVARSFLFGAALGLGIWILTQAGLWVFKNVF